LEDDKLSDTLTPQENAASLEDDKKAGGGTATTSATSFVATAAPKAVSLTHWNIAPGQNASGKTITEGTGLSDKFTSQESATSPEDDKKDGPEEDRKAGGGTITTLATSFVDTVAPKAVTSTRRNIAAGQKASGKAYTKTAVMQPNAKTRALLNVAKAIGDTESDADDAKSGTSTLNDLKVMVIMQLFEKKTETR